MKKVGKKTKFRITLLVIFFVSAIVLFVSSTFSFVSRYIINVQENNELQAKYNDKLEEEEKLKNEIERLKDPEYMARYAREKYLYSADDEIILKMEE